MSENPLEGLYDIDWAALGGSYDTPPTIIPLLLETLISKTWKTRIFEDEIMGYEDALSKLFYYIGYPGSVVKSQIDLLSLKTIPFILKVALLKKEPAFQISFLNKLHRVLNNSDSHSISKNSQKANFINILINHNAFFIGLSQHNNRWVRRGAILILADLNIASEEIYSLLSMLYTFENELEVKKSILYYFLSTLEGLNGIFSTSKVVSLCHSIRLNKQENDCLRLFADCICILSLVDIENSILKKGEFNLLVLGEQFNDTKLWKAILPFIPQSMSTFLTQWKTAYSDDELYELL
jgi:hypothetical protein